MEGAMFPIKGINQGINDEFHHIEGKVFEEVMEIIKEVKKWTLGRITPKTLLSGNRMNDTKISSWMLNQFLWG